MSNANGKRTEIARESFGSSSLNRKFRSSGVAKDKNLKPSRALTLELEHIDPSYGRNYGDEDESIGFITPESEKSVRIFDTNIRYKGAEKQKLSRPKSIQRGFSTATRRTLGFLNMTDDLTVGKQDKWMQLRKQHLEKLGKRPAFKSKSSSNIDATDAVASQDGQVKHAKNLHDILRMAQVSAPPMQRKKRENAAKVLWKAGLQSISTKPLRGLSTFKSYGGRSYAPSDLAGDDDLSVFSSSTNLDQADGVSRSLTATPMVTPVFKDSFFQFDAVSMRDEHPSTVADGRPDSVEAFTPGESIVVPFSVPYVQPEYKKVKPVTNIAVSSWDTERLGAEPSIRAVAPGEVGRSRMKPEYERGLSRGGRLMTSPEPKRKKKYNREFGKGFVGNLLNRTLDRRVINSNIEKQFEEVSNHRPFFTYWLSFVQVVIVIVMVSLYPFAPIGVNQRLKQGNILISRNGVSMKEYLSRKVQMSIWLGPKIETLIKLGAKYAPCMRKDKKVYAALEKERRKENETGCCMQYLLTGCIQRTFEDCISSKTIFAAKTVCGQDPQFCAIASIIPQKWDRDEITKWPICRKKKNLKEMNLDLYPHMRCEVTGHPCCVNTQGQCVITTEENCRFREGVYHPDANLCSQVDCLGSTCGMLGFSKDDEPDQFYRLILSLFLNAGILHLLVVLVFNFTVLRDIEVMAGWLRTALIFIFSGIGGNLWSAILIPYEPEVGELGASFGILSCLFVEVIQGWKLLQTPGMALGKLCGILILLLLFGLLPYIDNFAHIFGFIYGFFLSLILLPYVITDSWDKRRKQIQTVVSILFIIGLTVLGFVLFYNNYDINSGVIRYLNCVPITENFCQNFHQGNKLEPRIIEY